MDNLGHCRERRQRPSVHPSPAHPHGGDPRAQPPLGKPVLVLPPEKVMLFLVKFLKREEQASLPASVTVRGGDSRATVVESQNQWPPPHSGVCLNLRTFLCLSLEGALSSPPTPEMPPSGGTPVCPDAVGPQLCQCRLARGFCLGSRTEPSQQVMAGS